MSTPEEQAASRARGRILMLLEQMSLTTQERNYVWRWQRELFGEALSRYEQERKNGVSLSPNTMLAATAATLISLEEFFQVKAPTSPPKDLPPRFSK